MNGACNGKKKIAPPSGALGRGQKVKYHLISIYKVNFKYFYAKHWGRLGYPGGQKHFFFKHGHVTYQINGDDEQIRMQVKFSS